MIFLLIALLSIVGGFYFLKGKIAVIKKSQQNITFSSLPVHYCYSFALWLGVFGIAIFFQPFGKDNSTKILLLILAFITSFFATIFLAKKRFNAKKHVESTTKLILALSTLTGIIITFLITAAILVEAIKFFEMVNIKEFLFGLSWNPQIASYEDQAVGESSFGMIPVFLGTLMITVIAIAIAVPLGVMAAIYLSEYSGKNTRNILKPILEILAGIPTVVYGYFAVTQVAPFLRNFGEMIGINIASESALCAGLVMGIMIVPFILSLSDDAINAIPTFLKDGALALGSTKSEMIRKVVLLSAFPGIMSGILLAISRAIGETMIVVMAAGLTAKLTINPLDSVTTATAQMVTLLVGDQESDSPKTLAAFALGLVLFMMTLIFNIIALVVVKKYKEKYD